MFPSIQNVQQQQQHQHAGNEASNILGDKLQQKMDAITFTQERMKRQLDDLEGKTSVSKLFPIGLNHLRSI